jgi:hypothetical protein
VCDSHDHVWLVVTWLGDAVEESSSPALFFNLCLL